MSTRMPKRVLVKIKRWHATVLFDRPVDIEDLGAAVGVTFYSCEHRLDPQFFSSDRLVVSLVIYDFLFGEGDLAPLNLLKNTQSSLNKGH